MRDLYDAKKYAMFIEYLNNANANENNINENDYQYVAMIDYVIDNVDNIYNEIFDFREHTKINYDCVIKLIDETSCYILSNDYDKLIDFIKMFHDEYNDFDYIESFIIKN